MHEELRIPEIQVLSVNSINDLAGSLSHRARYFTLFLAWDAPEGGSDQFQETMRVLVEHGLAYFCAWGRNCETVHVAVDLAYIAEESDCGPLDFFTMTTSHQDESLEEALWFFRQLALPSEPNVFQNFERFAVAVGNPSWRNEIERLLPPHVHGI